MSKMNLHIESVDPKSLGESDIKKIAEVEKEMWAYGLGEYVKCKNCGLIHSKNDIFGHLSSEIRIECVTKLEDIFAGDVIKCKKCYGDTEFIYDVEKNIGSINNRYVNESYLVIGYDNDGDIKGFMDGYIADFSIIYKNELEHYYYLLGENAIKKMIEDIIKNRLSEKIFIPSSLGTEYKYANFFTLFNFLKEFFLSLPNISNILGISELDTGSNLHGIYHSLGAKGLGITLGTSSNLTYNKNTNYRSDIFIQENIIEIYKEGFGLGIKDFIKKNRQMINEIILTCKY